MANGFPKGNFRIVNKGTGACIASVYGGHDGYNTADREFKVHDTVKNTDEEIWHFDSRSGYRGQENRLYNEVRDLRGRWALCARVGGKVTGYKLRDHDVENFISLLPKQDEETLAHLKTNDCLDITRLLKSFILSNGEETIKSELVGKLDETKLNDSLNTALAYNSISSIEATFHKYMKFPLKFNMSNLENPLGAVLYKIIFASVQLDVLDQKDWESDSVFRLYFDHQNINDLLEKLKKENVHVLKSKVWKELQDVKDPQKEAVKIILELRKTLGLDTDEKNINTAKKILQTGLKSNESFEQLQTALNSTNGKGLQSLYKYSGTLFMQGAGRDEHINWAFEDGYIFVEGQPDAVLTHSWRVGIGTRSDDPNQRWELKQA